MNRRGLLKKIVGILLILNIIIFGMFLISLLYPYPLIAFPVSVVGIVICSYLLGRSKLQIPKNKTKEYYSDNSSSQESPSIQIAHTQRLKQWIKKLCRIFVCASLPKQIKESKKEQTNANKKQNSNNNLPNAHIKPPEGRL
jgi:H+/gluconate symporter-like permease